MSYSGAYVLHVECDDKSHETEVVHLFCGFTKTFEGNTQGAAILKARAAGWYVAQKGKRCLCPQHNTRENKP